jgi:hypothetical protein
VNGHARASERSSRAEDGWLARVARFFVAPAADAAPARATPIPPAARVVVLGAPAEVVAAAAAAALGLREPNAGLVAVWRGEPPRAGIATRAAARLSARVGSDECLARARGRLAWLALPADPGTAAAAVRRASALVAGPFVTALAGARPRELELLVAEHDIAIVVAEPQSPLARAALAALTARGIEAIAVPPLRRGPARRLALAGLTAPRLSAAHNLEIAGDVR